MKEVEIRAKARNPSKMAGRLEKEGALFVKSLEQVDYYLNPPEKDIYKSGMKYSIRLRVNDNEKKGHFIMCSVLGPITAKSKAREKRAVEVDDWKEFLALLKSSGFSAPYTIKKSRDIFLIDDIRVNLDRIRGIGNFIEAVIKGDDEKKASERIMQLFSRLKIEEEDIDNRLYLWMVMENAKGGSWVRNLFGKANLQKGPDNDFMEFIKGVQPSKVLDVGSKYGYESAYMAKKGFDVVAVDNDEEKLKKARRLASKEKVKVTFVKDDIFNYLKSAESSSFDAVIDVGFSHFLKIEEMERFYKEISKVLRHNGKFLTKIYSSQDPISRERCPKRKWTKIGGKYFHYHEKEHIQKMLEKNGFKVDKYSFESISDGDTKRIYHVVHATQTIKKW